MLRGLRVVLQHFMRSVGYVLKPTSPPYSHYSSTEQTRSSGTSTNQEAATKQDARFLGGVTCTFLARSFVWLANQQQHCSIDRCLVFTVTAGSSARRFIQHAGGYRADVCVRAFEAFFFCSRVTTSGAGRVIYRVGYTHKQTSF